MQKDLLFVKAVGSDLFFHRQPTMQKSPNFYFSWLLFSLVYIPPHSGIQIVLLMIFNYLNFLRFNEFAKNSKSRFL